MSISVSDKGIGIPADEIDNIFKPFKRATNVSYIGGFGIGLSIVSKVIELHGAEIKISSTDNKGTSVTLLFSRNIRSA